MVNLSIDPPPFGRPAPSGASGLGKLLALVIVLFAVFLGGFVAGRKTALRGDFLPPIRPSGAAAATATQPPTHPAAPTAPPATAASPAAPAPAPGVGAEASPAAPAPLAPAAVAGAPAAAPAAAPATTAEAPATPQGPRRISVTLQGPLEESVAAAIAPADKAWAGQLTQVVNRLLVWSMQVQRDARKGDKLEVLYELPSAQPTEVVAIGDAGPVGKEPVVLALRYGSQKLGKLLTAYRFKAEGEPFAHYYTSDGVDVEEHLVDSPVSGYEQITSLLRDGRRHKGVDYKTPVGTPVRAPFDGQIGRRNWHFSANGNCLELIDPRSGRKAIFLHLDVVPKEMQPGRVVKRGEVIARSGNSGHSTAPHLHYQIEAPDGRVLDPFAVLPTKKVTLAGPTKTAFDAERARLEPLLVAGR